MRAVNTTVPSFSRRTAKGCRKRSASSIRRLFSGGVSLQPKDRNILVFRPRMSSCKQSGKGTKAAFFPLGSSFSASVSAAVSARVLSSLRVIAREMPRKPARPAAGALPRARAASRAASAFVRRQAIFLPPAEKTKPTDDSSSKFPISAATDKGWKKRGARRCEQAAASRPAKSSPGRVAGSGQRLQAAFVRRTKQKGNFFPVEQSAGECRFGRFHSESLLKRMFLILAGAMAWSICFLNSPCRIRGSAPGDRSRQGYCRRPAAMLAAICFSRARILPVSVDFVVHATFSAAAGSRRRKRR